MTIYTIWLGYNVNLTRQTTASLSRELCPMAARIPNLEDIICQLTRIV